VDDREFAIEIRRALVIVIKALQKRYGLKDLFSK